MMSILSKINFQINILLQSIGLFVLASSVILGVVVSEPLWADTCNMIYAPVPHCVEQPSIECHTPADCNKVVAKYTLTLEMKGGGKGQVSGGGTYEQGISITLTAQPDADSLFSGWQPKDQCVDGMTLSANITCTAIFDPKPSTTENSSPPSSPSLVPQEMSLWIQVDGSGSGKVSGTGLSCHRDDCQNDTKGELHCASNCTQLIQTGNTVTLTPEADSNSIFSSWGGSEDCAGGKVTMDQSKRCVAYFHRIYSLTVATQGAGKVSGYGYYTLKPLIECGSKCQVPWENGMKIVLEAWPAEGMVFDGWRGDCSGTEKQLILPFNKDMSCQAIFLNPTTVLNKLNQTITDFSPVTPMEVGKQITLTATGGASGNPVTFASSTPEFCTVSDHQTVTFAKAGTCKVIADQAGNEQYHAAPTVTASIEVKPVEVPLVKQNQEITHFSPTDYSFTVDKAMVNGKTTLIATGGASGNPVTYASTTPAICTVSGNTVSLVGVGTCTITADQAGNDLYYPAPQVITQIQVNQPVEQANQATSNWSLVTTSVVGSSLTLTGTGDTSGNPVTFTSTTPTICTMLDNKTIRFDAIGICTVIANQTGNAMSTVAAQITVESPSSPSTVPSPSTMPESSSPPSKACPDIKEENGVLIVSSSCDAQGEIFDKPVRILPGTSISNATFNNTVDNHGFLSNIKLGEKGEVKGGMLSGFVDSQGKVCDVEFVGSSFVGGTLCGKIENASEVGGCLKKVTSLPNTEITGCVEKQPQEITVDVPETSAVITNPTVTEVTDMIEIDPLARDFYIFGDNVRKNGNVEALSDVSGQTYQADTNTSVPVVWSEGSPIAFSTGSVNYDVCQFGEHYAPKQAISCEFTVKMPSTEATLDFWLILVGNTGDLRYNVIVGKTPYSDSYPEMDALYRRFTYNITQAKPGEVITVRVDNVSGSNGWHNIGFLATQLTSKVEVSTSKDTTDIIEDKVDTSTTNDAEEITKQEQMINLQISAREGIVGDVLSVTATGGTSGNPVKLEATPPEHCSLQDGNLKLLKAGSCEVKASQAGNAKYFDAEPVLEHVFIKTDRAIFTANVLSDKDFSGTLTTISVTDRVDISLDITVAPKDIGKTANVFLAAKMGEFWWVPDTKGNWQEWDGQLTSLTPLTIVTFSTMSLNIPFYHGTLSAGVIELYAAYQLVGSTQLLDQGPQRVLSLTVKNEDMTTVDELGTPTTTVEETISLVPTI